LEYRKVAVTGIGLITPLGTGTEKTWNALLQGKSGAGHITQFDTTGFSVNIAAEVKDFDPLLWMEKPDVRRMARFIHFAYCASILAMESAGLKTGDFDPLKAGIVIGSGIGGIDNIEKQKEILLKEGPRKISPFFVPSQIINMASGFTSIKLGLKGPNSAVVTACSTGNHAIGDAFNIIRRGDADIMIAGGSEACITPLSVGGFAVMRALSPRNHEPEKASRPFDLNRDGFLIAEGAGILVLEDMESAKKRGADIKAEIVGYGMTGDAFHITAPDESGNGPARVMKATMKDAGITADDVDYINAHGTSTPPGDKIETTAIKTAFGERAYKIPVSSTKSMTGHMLGAAGGAECAFTILALKNQIIPPTINLDTPDPDCDLDYVPWKPRKATMTYALSNSFGFGGTNSCIAFKRYGN
jgi:3-oxoacyl-[acyl-carrier-protein] synthase II